MLSFRCTCQLADGVLHADLLPDNPYDTMKHGCDFLRHNALPCIDFCTLVGMPACLRPCGVLPCLHQP